MEIWRGNCLLLMILLARTPHGIKLQDLKLLFARDSPEEDISQVTAIQDINERSLSPWNYTMQTSRSRTGCIRFPKEISEATCLFERCIDANNNVIHNLNSVPIYQEILVIKFNKKSRDSIKLEPRMISVGCTCVKSKVMPQE